MGSAPYFVSRGFLTDAQIRGFRNLALHYFGVSFCCRRRLTWPSSNLPSAGSLLPSPLPDGLYTYMGSDEPDVPDNDGRPKENTFHSNTIKDVDIAVKIKEGDDNVFTGERKKYKSKEG